MILLGILFYPADSALQQSKIISSLFLDDIMTREMISVLESRQLL